MRAVRREGCCPHVLTERVRGVRLQVSEVGAGSDVAAIKTTAVRDGDEYVINGGKMWTTNGTQADWICLLANTGEGAIHENKSLICVPMDAPGVTFAPRFAKLGMRSSDTTQVRTARRVRHRCARRRPSGPGGGGGCATALTRCSVPPHGSGVQVWLENVRVPVDNIIGEEGKGFQYQMIQFQVRLRTHAAPTVLA